MVRSRPEKNYKLISNNFFLNNKWKKVPFLGQILKKVCFSSKLQILLPKSKTLWHCVYGFHSVFVSFNYIPSCSLYLTYLSLFYYFYLWRGIFTKFFQYLVKKNKEFLETKRSYISVLCMLYMINVLLRQELRKRGDAPLRGQGVIPNLQPHSVCHCYFTVHWFVN